MNNKMEYSVQYDRESNSQNAGVIAMPMSRAF